MLVLLAAAPNTAQYVSTITSTSLLVAKRTQSKRPCESEHVIPKDWSEGGGFRPTNVRDRPFQWRLTGDATFYGPCLHNQLRSLRLRVFLKNKETAFDGGNDATFDVASQIVALPHGAVWREESVQVGVCNSNDIWILSRSFRDTAQKTLQLLRCIVPPV